MWRVEKVTTEKKKKLLENPSQTDSKTHTITTVAVRSTN